MRTLIAIAAVAALFVLPNVTAATTLAEGDVLAGWPILVAGGLNAVSFTAPAGTVVQAITTDNSGLGYDVDILFFDADGNSMDASCATEAPDEEPCTVPAGATDMYAHAYMGADLHIVVVAL